MNEPKSPGMSPVIKGGLACCALIGLVCLVVGGFVAYKFSTAMSLDPQAVRIRMQASTGGGELPSGMQGRFSMDMGVAKVHFATATDPTALTLAVFECPPASGQGMPEHQFVWKNIVGPFAPAPAAQGVDLSMANHLAISDTGETSEVEIEAGDKTFKATLIPCKKADGTELKRLYIRFKDSGGSIRGAFAIGKVDGFDEDALKEFLAGCQPK